MMKEHRLVANKSAVLLVNLGSPDAPTTKALRKYLREFLSDERVIDLPRWQWLPILYGIVLNTRPKKSAHAYQQVWTEAGAPLIVITDKQTQALKAKLREQGVEMEVAFAMRYGNPSLASAFAQLAAKGVERVLVVPMYPQYSDATTASVFDGVAMALKKRRFIPELRFVRQWHDAPKYIQALTDSALKQFAENGCPDVLLLSFHGVPERFLHEGDPYFCHCHKTARLLQAQLKVHYPKLAIELVFQSRFGREKWLTPYADEKIIALAKAGKSVSVMCPGFSADCLETLEEMAMGNRDVFLENGGVRYDYIPALNDDALHIELLSDLVLAHSQDWLNLELNQTEQQEICRRARKWQENEGVVHE